MHDGGDAIALRGLDVTGKQHEPWLVERGADLEPFVGMFGHHARRKGAGNPRGA